jgi:hypothetical protein
MDKSAIVGSPKRPWVGYVATIAAVLLGEFAVAIPAHSGDLYNPYDRPYAAPYGYGPYQYGPGPVSYYQGAAYRPHCNPCGCVRCGCTWRCAPIVHRSNVIERRWVDHEYVERRYDGGGPYYRPYGYAGGYPSGYGAPGYGGPGYGGPGYGGPGDGGPRPHIGYGGINYGPYPISYDYDAPRPPVGIPGPYYNDGYVE